MSDKHKQILLAGNAAIERGDHEGFLLYCTEDTEWIFVGEQTLKGKEAVRQWMADSYPVPPRVAVDHLVAEGDHLIAIGEVTMSDNAGKSATYYYSDAWTFRDGLIAGLKGFVIEKK